MSGTILSAPKGDDIASAPTPNVAATNPPPSTGPRRALRRLQSAHNLGSPDSRNGAQPVLTSQQRQYPQQQQQNLQPLQTPSPVRKDQTGAPHLQPFKSHNRVRSNSDASVLSVPSQENAVRSQVVVKKASLAETAVLDRLIRDGPPNGDLSGALETTRLKILDQGIKSDSDGMVTFKVVPIHHVGLTVPVFPSNICMAHSFECSTAQN